MRHNKKFNHLGRKKAHRDALLANMTISLILHKRIFTTLAKAKALRIYAEPLINRAKNDRSPGPLSLSISGPPLRDRRFFMPLSRLQVAVSLFLAFKNFSYSPLCFLLLSSFSLIRLFYLTFILFKVYLP